MTLFAKRISTISATAAVLAALCSPGSFTVGAAYADGIGLGAGASIGGHSGVNAGAGASIGGRNGVSAGLGASVGGRNGVNAGAGANVGGTGGVSAGLGASVGGSGGVNAGAGAQVGSGVGVGVGVSIGGAENPNHSIGGGTGIFSPSDPTTTTSISSAARDRLAGLSGKEIARYKKRCVNVLSDSGSYDSDLIALCRAVRGM